MQTFWWSGIAAVTFVAACGAGSRATQAPTPVVDAGVPVTGRCTGAEAADGAAGGGGASYVIASLEAPSRSTQARDYGCDLDGDGSPDNQLGNVLSALRGYFDSQADLDAWLQDGQLVALVRFGAGVPTADGPAEVDLVRGCHAMQPFDPAVAFGGMGTFHVAGRASRLTGSIAGGVASLSGDRAELALPFFGPPREAGAVLMGVFGVRLANVRVTADGLMEGNLCGAIPQASIDAELVPQLATMLHDRVALGGETAVRLCEVFDFPDRRCASRPEDCAHYGPTNPAPGECMRQEDVRSNLLTAAVFKPDVTLQNGPAMSFGYRFTAVPARF